MKEMMEGRAKQQLTPVRVAPKPPSVTGFPGPAVAPYPVAGPTAAPANSWGMPISPTSYPATSNLPHPINPMGMPTRPPTYR